MEKVLSIDEKNAKYEKQRSQKNKLVIKASNKIILEEFKENYMLNMDGYVFKSIDTFSEKFLTTYFAEGSYHPRVTFAYIKENRGYILDKNPNSGEKQIAFNKQEK